MQSFFISLPLLKFLEFIRDMLPQARSMTVPPVPIAPLMHYTLRTHPCCQPQPTLAKEWLIIARVQSDGNLSGPASRGTWHHYHLRLHYLLW
jgi:hypothetical protein